MPSLLQLSRNLALVGLVAGLPVVARAADAVDPSPATAPAQNSPPRVEAQVPAVYPPEAVAEARAQGHPPPAGQVTVLVEIDSHGQVADVTISGGVSPLLDRAAVAAARQWHFAPALREGAPAPSRVTLLFPFTPPPEERAAPSPTPASPSPAPPLPVPPAEEEKKDDDAIDVTVLGRRKPPSRGASDFDVQVGRLKEVPRANASDFLKLAPGILLSNEGGEGHAEQVFMRGFDAREGQDIEFTVGGVPINESGNLHGNGYADTHFIIPELITGLRVVEGPFDPRQGNFAVAGSADYELGLLERGVSLRASAGSFGTRRYLGLWGPPGESVHTFAGAEVSTTDGFGQNRDATRAAVMGQYEGRLGGAGTFRLGAQLYATHYHAAGIVREDDLAAGRLGFFDSYDLLGATREQVREGGDASRASLYGDLETRRGDTTFSQQVFVIAREMRLLENFTGFLLDVQEPLQSLHPQRGDMLDLAVTETTFGARGAGRVETRWRDLRQELEVGYFARADRVAGKQQRLEATTGVPYATETNLASQIGDLALYADVNLHPLSWLTLRGGGRVEMLAYDVHDLCAAQSVSKPSAINPPIDESCLSQQNNGRPREPDQRASTASTVFLPRASLLVGPFRELTFSASAGRGVRSTDPSYVSQDVATPFADVRAYEVGASYARDLGRTRLSARTVVFETLVDRELVFSETEGRNTLGGGTTRVGWLGALRLSGPFFDQAANLTLVRATLDENHQAIPYISGTVLRSDTSLFAPSALAARLQRWGLGQLSLNLGLTWVGPRPLPYGEQSRAIVTVDGAAALRWKLFELRLSVSNVLDRRQRSGEYNFASDFRSAPQPTLVPERSFTAAPPRAFLVSFGFLLGGA